jgi:hypothetical protein
MSDISAAPAPVFLNPGAREKAIDLDYPIAYDGRDYARILIRRMTVADVAGFLEACKAAGDGVGDLRFPMFFHPDGTAVPDAVHEAIDPDDQEKLSEATLSFLPRRFRDEPASATVPAAGANIAPT